VHRHETIDTTEHKIGEDYDNDDDEEDADPLVYETSTAGHKLYYMTYSTNSQDNATSIANMYYTSVDWRCAKQQIYISEEDKDIRRANNNTLATAL